MIAFAKTLQRERITTRRRRRRLEKLREERVDLRGGGQPIDLHAEALIAPEVR